MKRIKNLELFALRYSKKVGTKKFKIKDIIKKDDVIYVKFDFYYKNKMYKLVASQDDYNDIKVYSELANYHIMSYSKNARLTSWGGFIDKLNKSFREKGNLWGI